MLVQASLQQRVSVRAGGRCRMVYLEPPDITREPERANIERILAYLSQLEAVPGDALDALEGLLVRAEVAEQRAAADAKVRATPDTMVTVQIPPSRRAAFQRHV